MSQNEYEPTSNYAIRKIEGWTIYVNRQLLNDKKKIGSDLWSSNCKTNELQLLDIKFLSFTETEEIAYSYYWQFTIFHDIIFTVNDNQVYIRSLTIGIRFQWSHWSLSKTNSKNSRYI